MPEFLHGDALSKKIREIVQGDDVRCAVAFWGNGAVNELFGTERLNRSDVQIVCDISMGGTNPGTLRALGAPDSENIRHIHGLHAKVYHSSIGMITGSANASSNGVGFMGRAAVLREAGVFIDPKETMWDDTKTWFETEIWKNSDMINQHVLLRAQTAWKNRYFANNRVPFVDGLRRQEARDFLDYRPDEHGLVYLHWYSGNGGELNENAPEDIRNDLNNKWINVADGDIQLHGSWICCFRLNNQGMLHGGERGQHPEFFFIDSMIRDAVDEPLYPHLAFQGLSEAALPAPFAFERKDRFREAFRMTINSRRFAALRTQQDDAWCATNYADLTHQFWGAVQVEYGRLQQYA